MSRILFFLIKDFGKAFLLMAKKLNYHQALINELFLMVILALIRMTSSSSISAFLFFLIKDFGKAFCSWPRN
jgi:hypothetical protein